MRADNTHHLRGAVEQRQRDTRQRAHAALADMQPQDQPISVSAFARAASVARSWIYTQPELLAAITASQVQIPTDATTSPSCIQTVATEDSWKQRLELAHARIHELTHDNQALRHQLAQAHGQLRAQRTAGGATRTPPTTQTPS